MQRHFENSDSLCKYIADRSDEVVLAFSLGKDSIGTWIQLRRYFKRIVPFYLYLIPDLDFVNTSIKYFEEVFETKIIQLPHPSLYRMLNNFVFQAPENCWKIENMYLKRLKYNDIRAMVVCENNLDNDIFTGYGIRACDSIQRHISIKRYGVLNPKKNEFFPIFDWNKARLLEEIKDAGIKLPIDYILFGRSFDGIDFRFLKPIHDYFPEDYRRILEYFPLVELEIKRREWRTRYYEEKEGS